MVNKIPVQGDIINLDMTMVLLRYAYNKPRNTEHDDMHIENYRFPLIFINLYES